MPLPLREEDVIFPSASREFSVSQTLTALKRSNLAITNRLHSIARDAAFVASVAETYKLPLIANERCGSWYIDPRQKVGSAYFKSTDGHHGQWSLSLRRLNIHVFDLMAANAGTRGCIVVDSTRRGKSMPDALSKTVPIWIAVLNRLIFPELTSSHYLVTPEEVVSRSEHAQIESRLDSFFAELRSLNLDVDHLRVLLDARPLESIWITSDTPLPPQSPVFEHGNLVVLCTASGRMESDDRTPLDYVQGAADDSESWALGLDAASFWQNKDILLSTAEDDLPQLIESIVKEKGLTTFAREPSLIKPTDSIFIANNVAAEQDGSKFDIIISCVEEPNRVLVETLKHNYITLQCSQGKIGSRQLRVNFTKLDDIGSVLLGSPGLKILITCHSGRDLAVGVALVILCRFYSEDGRILSSRPDVSMSKSWIKNRLSKIVLSMPDAAPSRATLQSVNAYLLG